MKVGTRVRIRGTGETATVIEPPCTFRCIRVEIDPDPALETRGRRRPYLHVRDVERIPPRPRGSAA